MRHHLGDDDRDEEDAAADDVGDDDRCGIERAKPPIQRWGRGRERGDGRGSVARHERRYSVKSWRAIFTRCSSTH